MKSIPTKHQLRNELRQQTDEFLSSGGEITRVDPGESGYPGKIPGGRQTMTFDGPKQTYTYVPELVAALDARKVKKSPPASKKTPPKPRRKVIYDDFGEPVRKISVEE